MPVCFFFKANYLIFCQILRRADENPIAIYFIQVTTLGKNTSNQNYRNKIICGDDIFRQPTLSLHKPFDKNTNK
jgi:hypothetical protein